MNTATVEKVPGGGDQYMINLPGGQKRYFSPLAHDNIPQEVIYNSNGEGTNNANVKELGKSIRSYKSALSAYSYKSLMAISSAYSMLSIMGVFTMFGFLSLGSMMSFCSLFSMSSAFSVFSMNSVWSVGCINASHQICFGTGSSSPPDDNWNITMT